MSFIKTLLGNIFSGVKKAPANQPPAPQLAPPPVPLPQPQVSQLDRDMQEYKDRVQLGSAWKAHELEEAMKAKYSGQALVALRVDLSQQPGASSGEDALALLEAACMRVSSKFPLKWVVANQRAEKFGLSIRFQLIGHNVWINENGAYCIVQLEGKRLNDDDEVETYRQGGITIITMPNAHGVAFTPPQGYINGTE